MPPLFQRRHYEALAALPLAPEAQIIRPEQYLQASGDAAEYPAVLTLTSPDEDTVNYRFSRTLRWDRNDLLSEGIPLRYVEQYADGDIVPLYSNPEFPECGTVPGWDDWWFLA
jgi:hypothetical protein